MSLQLASRPRSWRTGVVVLVAAVAVTAACSDGDAAAPPTTQAPTTSPSSSSTTAAPTVELAGSSWQLTAIERDGEEVDATSEVPAVVSFAADELEAYDGVNTAAGSYRVESDELTVDALFTTEIASTGPALAQHELFSLLERGGTLVVSDADGLRIELDETTTLVFDRTAGGVPS